MSAYEQSGDSTTDAVGRHAEEGAGARVGIRGKYDLSQM